MDTVDTSGARRGNTNKPRSRKGELRGRAWMATLFTRSRTQIQELLDSMDCQWVYQKERCPNTHNIHFHVGIYFRNPRGIAFQSEWPIETHWDKCRRWPETVKYCTKVPSRVDGPWTNIEGLTWRQTLKDPMDGKIPYPWQRDILQMIEEEPDDRAVY